MRAHNGVCPSRVTTVDLSLEEHAHRVWIQSLPDAVPVLEKIEAWMLGRGYPRIDRFAVALAACEAITNAVQHGHAADPTKLVQITFAVRPDEVVIDVQDQGPGFDPALVPNPLHPKKQDQHDGWGLFRIQSYATWLTIEPPGNRITFGRRRTDG